LGAVAEWLSSHALTCDLILGSVSSRTLITLTVWSIGLRLVAAMCASA
jgi:phosphohistidine phosphatase SixA